MNETANPRRLVSWLSLRCMRQIGQDPSGQRGQSFALPAVFVVAHFFLSFTFSLWGCPMKWSAVDRCCRGWQAKHSVQVYVRVCPCVRAHTRIVGTALGPVSPVLQSMAGTKPQGQGVNDISLSLLLYVSLSPAFISAALSKSLLCKYEKYRNAMFFS